MPSLSQQLTKELTYAEVAVFLVASVILAQLWLRFYENLLYETLGYSNTSTYVSYVLAIVTTVFSLVLIVAYPYVLLGTQGTQLLRA